MPMPSSDPFVPFARKLADSGQPALVTELFRRAYERLRGGETGKVSSADIDVVQDVTEIGDLARYHDAGVAALGSAVVIKLNGGLGTTMGLTQAKSLLPVKDDLTFLDVIVRQVLHLRRAHDARVPLVLMNSFRTREDSARVLGRYPDLASGLPADFLQHKVPRILAADLSPVSWPSNPEYEWCPPGHGDIYAALQTSGLVHALRDAGIRYAFVSNADNLGAVLDPDILGWIAAERVPFVMEMCDRSEADKKGGHVARRRDGRLMLREFSQCPDEELDSFQDIARWRYFNTNTLWIDLDALARVLEASHGVIDLPLIVNRKPVDPDQPSSPQVIQLETAMGAGIALFEGARALHVTRRRFAPVKSSSDLLALWSDAYELTDDYRMVPSPARRAGDLVVDLDPKHFRQVDDLRARFREGPPSLLRAGRFVVRGDVRFGGGVIVEGDVEVRQSGAETLVVPAGATLTG
jgi:UTP--glucose-1-phosphate uridylyltransferase